MAFHNINYQIVPLSGTVGPDVLGDGLSATTVHEVYCLSNGTIRITAIGGGTASFPMTAGQTLKMLCGGITVSSGTFVGFRSKLQKGGRVIL